MKIPSLLFLCLLVTAGCALNHARSKPGAPPPESAPILYGAVKYGVRIGLTNPKPTYQLHQPIHIALYYDSAAEHHMPPANYVGSDIVLLTLPDGTVKDFPADTQIDTLGPAGAVWLTPLDLDSKLENHVHAPGTYKLQWVFGPLVSPTISFRVVR